MFNINKLNEKFNSLRPTFKFSFAVVKHLKAFWFKLFITKKVMIKYMTLILSLSSKGVYAEALSTLVEKRNIYYPKKERNITRFYQHIYDQYSTTDKPDLRIILAPFLDSSTRLILLSNDNEHEALSAVITNLNEGNRLSGILLSALMKPLVYIIVLFVIANITQSGTIDVMKSSIIALGKDVTGSLLLLSNINEFIISIQFSFFVITFIAIIVCIITLPNLCGRNRTLLEAIPLVNIPFRLYRKRQAIVFLQTLAHLFSAGFTTATALSKIIENSTPYMKYHSKKILARFENIGSEDYAFRVPLFDVEIQYLLSVFLQSDDAIDDMINITKSIEKEVEITITRSANILPNAIFVILGLYAILSVIAFSSFQTYLPR